LFHRPAARRIARPPPPPRGAGAAPHKYLDADYLAFIRRRYPEERLGPNLTAERSSELNPDWAVRGFTGLLHRLHPLPVPPATDRAQRSTAQRLRVGCAWWCPRLTSGLSVSVWLLRHDRG
jgi:hypothetical protein